MTVEMAVKTDIKSLTLEELKNELSAWGEKSFRAKQIYEWMHIRGARSFEEMTNISKALREKLSEQYELTSLTQIQMQESAIDGTRKYLFGLRDGKCVDEVSSWQLGMHLVSGGMQDGLSLLCFHAGWIGAESERIGNAGPDLCHQQTDRRKSIQRGGYGNRGADG